MRKLAGRFVYEQDVAVLKDNIQTARLSRRPSSFGKPADGFVCQVKGYDVALAQDLAALCAGFVNYFYEPVFLLKCALLAAFAICSWLILKSKKTPSLYDGGGAGERVE